MVVATGLGHQPRTGLAMPDVVRRLVKRRAAQLVVATAAGDQEMTQAPALCGCFRAGVQMQSFHPTVCGLPHARESREGKIGTTKISARKLAAAEFDPK